jgi:hypothetical protein
MDELEEIRKLLPETFGVPKIAEVLHVNRTSAYMIAKKPGVGIQVGRRLVVIRSGFLKWLEIELQRDKTKAM